MTQKANRSRKSKAGLNLRLSCSFTHPPDVQSTCPVPGLHSRCQAEQVMVSVLIDQMRPTGWTPPAMSNLNYRGNFTGEVRKSDQ